MEKTYEETFDLMVAYHKLGERENKIIQYLMTMSAFDGSYSELAKKLNMNYSNLRFILLYLDALGIVHIVRDKYIDEEKTIVRKDGKTMTFNKMKACFLVDGWMDILVKRYNDGNIYDDIPSKRAFVEQMKALWSE